ncbi:MAG: methyltransferase domain-containing protein [Clostridiaceae bacterium]|nr:methyltransferase domain-containing protein [Clostridiaceae bacterium]
MEPIINWAVLQDILRPKFPDQLRRSVNWSNTAVMYNMMAEMERSYTYNQTDCIPVTDQDTVLDIGCGPGRISCAIAERAKSVTALDSSESMLSFCAQNAKNRNLSNVHTVHMDWKEAVVGENVSKHDIVIASRSVAMQDLKKLNSFAKKYAVLVCWANAPSIPPILNILFQGTRPEQFQWGSMPTQDRRIGYNVAWNRVYDMGADPNIRIVKDGFTKNFTGYTEAYEWLRLIRPFEDEYLPVFKENLAPYLTEEADGTVTFRIETKSYVLWWKPVIFADD